jgi:tetratricopeptide (TPR) repeat protein
MAADKQRRAFISYSRTNKEFATKLTKGLRSAGYPVWFDLFDIPTGSRWDDEVEKALRECSIFMIILTPASIASENVKDEIGYAIDHGKRILPILLEQCEVPLRLRRFQYVDFTAKNFEEGLESAKELLGDLVDEASVPIPAQAPVVEAQSDHFGFEREKLIKASTLLAQGKRLAQEKDWSQAAQTFRQVLALMPNHDETQTLLSNAEIQLSQKAEAEQLAQVKVEAEDKNTKEKLSNTSLVASPTGGALEKFIAEIDHLELNKPAEEYYKRGDELMIKNQFDDAILEFVKVIRISSPQEKWYKSAQVSLKEMGFSEADIRQVGIKLPITPSVVVEKELPITSSVVSPKGGALEKFIAEIDQLELNKPAEEYYKRGNELIIQGQFDDAILEFVKVIRISSPQEKWYQSAQISLKEMGFSEADIRQV